MICHQIIIFMVFVCLRTRQIYPFLPTPGMLVFFNNSETVKAETLPLCNIQQHFIRNIRAKCGVYNSPQSPDTAENSDGDISDFRISVHSLIKETCHNSRTSDDI